MLVMMLLLLIMTRVFSYWPAKAVRVHQYVNISSATCKHSVYVNINFPSYVNWTDQDCSKTGQVPGCGRGGEGGGIAKYVHVIDQN